MFSTIITKLLQQWPEQLAAQETWALEAWDQGTGQDPLCPDRVKLDRGQLVRGTGGKELARPVSDLDPGLVLDLDTVQGNSITKYKRGAPRGGAPRL